MDHFKKISKVNLGVLLGYTLLINLIFGTSSGRYDDLGGMLMMCMVLSLHALILFVFSIICFFNRKHKFGVNYLLMLGAVSLIGFSFCVGRTYL